MSLTPRNETPLLALRNITRRFPGVIANRNVDLNIYAGEVHTLLGENGAGKSTLMKIASGVYQPDEGYLLVNRERVEIRSPRDAFGFSIGMVHQHYMLIESFTVLENIILGLEGSPFSLDEAKARTQIRQLAQQYGFEAPLDELVSRLSIGEQQRVEILRLLYRATNVLIFDEPTAALTPHEAERLGEIMKQLAAEGKAIIYITHKLQQALDVADVITVMRKGEIIGTAPSDEVDEDQLVQMMIGQQLPMPKSQIKTERDVVALQVANLSTESSGRTSLRNVNMQVFEGEILGVAGISGNGQHELAETLAGLRKPTEGTIWIGGRALTELSPLNMIRVGVSYVPGDRMRLGLVASLPVRENVILKRYRHPEMQFGPFIDRKAASDWAQHLISEFDIVVPDEAMPVRLLSGGNQQKAILARELSESYRVLIVEHPTRGLDVRARNFVHEILRQQRAANKAILLISADLDELLGLSDRIVVMYEGQIVGEVTPAEADAHQLGYMMTGQTDKVVHTE